MFILGDNTGMMMGYEPCDEFPNNKDLSGINKRDFTRNNRDL